MKKIIIQLRKSTLLKSGIWYTIANFFLKGVNFISIPLFTQLMSVKEYGVINNFSAWVYIVTFFVGLNLNSAISNANFEFKKNIDRFMSSVLFLSILVFILITSIIMIPVMILNLDYGLSNLIIFNVLLQSFATFVVSYKSAYYMIRNQYIKNIILSFWSTLANFGTSVFFMMLFYKSSPDLGRIYGSTVGLTILAVVIIIDIISRGKKLIQMVYWKYAIKLSVPIIPHSLGNILLSQFDRIMITQYLGDKSAGIYSFSYNISTVINVLWLSLNNAWIPWFYTKMQEKKYNNIKKTMGIFIQIFSVLTLVSINILFDIGKIMGNESYIEGLGMIFPISLGYFFIFLYGFPVNTEFFYKKTGFIGVITSISAILNILLNIYFIPRFGYVAGAYTTLVTFVFQFICHLIMGNRIERAKGFKIFDYSKMWKYAFIMVTYSSMLMLFEENILIRYCLMVIVGGVIALNSLKEFKRGEELS